MRAFGRFAGIPLLMLIGVGCASMPHEKGKGPKTLLEWAGGPEDKKDDKDKEKEENSVEEEKPIQTDRPDYTEASSTVPAGRIQLEAGYTFFHDRGNGGTFSQHSYPEALFRIGVNEWFELRIAQNFLSQTSTETVEETGRGPDDLYIGTKLGLTEQKAYLPETALIIQATLPTGNRAFTANRILPGLNYCFGWDVIEDCLSVGGSLQANAAVDDLNHSYVELSQSITVGYTLTKKFGAYTEWFAFYPTGAIAPDVTAQHYFDGGFTYKLTNDIQFDIRGGVGLNSHAINYFVGSGFAVRY